MYRTNTRRPIHLFTVESEHWTHPAHRHNHYELIFVEKGNGFHHINNMTEPFQKGDILFIQPEDAHYYTIINKVKLAYVKFLSLPGSDHSLRHAGNAATGYRKLPHTNCVPQLADNAHMFRLLAVMQHEYTLDQTGAKDNLPALLTIMWNIITRNAGASLADAASPNAQTVTDMLAFLADSVHQSRSTDLQLLASTFNRSANYINTLVKRQTGLTIHRHLIKFKMEAACKLLLHSGMNVNEIAQLLGFTDASHFSNTFKKEQGLSPTAFKKK